MITLFLLYSLGLNTFAATKCVLLFHSGSEVMLMVVTIICTHPTKRRNWSNRFNIQSFKLTFLAGSDSAAGADFFVSFVAASSRALSSFL